MTLKERKRHLIVVLKAKALGSTLTPEQIAQFELMYRRAKDESEQDQVTAVLDNVLTGWKTGSDYYARLRQGSEGIDPFEEDDDPLPPTLQDVFNASQAEFGLKRS